MKEILIFALMKTQLKFAAAGIALFLCAGASAQTLDDAIKLTDNEQYEKANSMFLQLAAKEPANGDVYFYFGDLKLQDGDADTAKIIFQKGIDINATNPLVHVGMARYYMYSGKMADGEKEMAYAKSLLSTQAGPKNDKMPVPRQVTIYLEMAETYTWAAEPNPQMAIDLTNTAEKLDAKNPSAEIFLIRGDALQKQNPVNASPAIEAYNKAAQRDPKSCRAYVRIGQIYAAGKNMPAAIGYFNKAISTEPNFGPAYRLRGEAQYQVSKFDSASISYKKYLDLNNDCHSRYRYCAFLYKSGDYENAIKEGETVLACDSSIVVVYRIVGRCYMDQKTPDPAKSVQYFNLFFKKQKVYGKPAIIPEDYVSVGKAFAKDGNDSMAIVNYKLALKADTSRKDGYFEIGSAYFKMRNYDSAAYYYKRKIDLAPANASISDWNAYGRSIYLLKDYAGASEAFSHVTQMDSLNPIGWYWRGRCEAQLDPEIKSDNARMMYERFYAVAIGDKERNKKDLIIAAKYLGGYHLVKKNYGCSKAWFQFALDLDPNNADLKKQMEEKEMKTATASDLNSCMMTK